MRQQQFRRRRLLQAFLRLRRLELSLAGISRVLAFRRVVRERVTRRVPNKDAGILWSFG